MRKLRKAAQRALAPTVVKPGLARNRFLRSSCTQSEKPRHVEAARQAFGASMSLEPDELLLPETSSPDRPGAWLRSAVKEPPVRRTVTSGRAIERSTERWASELADSRNGRRSNPLDAPCHVSGREANAPIPTVPLETDGKVDGATLPIAAVPSSAGGAMQPSLLF
jgi:hypothetical protein